MIRQIKPPIEVYQGTCEHCKAEYTWEEPDCISSMTTPSIYCPHCGHIIKHFNWYKDLGITWGLGQSIPCVDQTTVTLSDSSTTSTIAVNNREDNYT